MDKELMTAYLGIALLLAFIVPLLFFLHAQQKTLQYIRLEHRLMRPGQVWLQLIPVFGQVWQFFVISRIATSIQTELNTPTDDSIFAPEQYVKERPTYSIGVQYAVLYCCSIIPLPGISSILAIAAMGCWIRYWIQLSRYQKILRERALVLGTSLA